jgi:uncharacterized RDD family membrane protein YckC
MHGAVLDTVVATETPEGILLELRPAGLSARCYAFLLDWMLQIFILSTIGIVTTIFGRVGVGVYAIATFLVSWFYPVAFELSRWGGTPGKRAFDLKVVMDNGLPITPAASLTRNLLRVADFLPFLFGFGIASMLLRRDFKRLGDIAAATLVVHQPRHTLKFAPPQVELIQPALLLAPRDQAAVIALAARAGKLTRDRMDELAALAASVSGDAGRSGPDVTQRVLGVAQWLLGHR